MRQSILFLVVSLVLWLGLSLMGWRSIKLQELIVTKDTQIAMLTDMRDRLVDALNVVIAERDLAREDAEMWHKAYNDLSLHLYTPPVSAGLRVSQ